MKTKVKAAGFGGSLATVLVWAASQAGVDMPDYVAAAVASLVCVAAGWFKSDDQP